MASCSFLSMPWRFKRKSISSAFTMTSSKNASTGERKVAVDAVFDSVSVGTTFKAELAMTAYLVMVAMISCSVVTAMTG